LLPHNSPKAGSMGTKLGAFDISGQERQSFATMPIL
jgi:hypothetical protein